MSNTTTYDVMLRYRMDNKAGKEAEHLADSLGHAAHAGGGLGHVLGHIGALAGGVFGIHGAWKAMVDFNSEVQNAKISLTAMVEGGFGGSFEYAKGQAEALYSEFQKFSQQTPMTTQEMLQFSRSVAMGVQGAGGSIKDIINVTEQGAIAAKAYGFEASLAGREITEMLQGNIRSTEPFTKALASAGHKTLEELRAMTAEQRLEFLKTTLNSPALKDATASMATSFSGVTSTLVDKLEILMGKVGLPLFQAITAEVGRWNEWIDKNQMSIEHFSQSVAGGLVNAFELVRSAFAFIYDHADTFLSIGKVWAAIKVGNMLGGAALGGGGGGGMMSALGNLGSNVSGKGGLNVGQVLGPVMFAGVGAYELAKAAGLDDVGANLGKSLADLKTDGIASEFERVTKSTQAFDQALVDAASRMGGDSNQSRLQGAIDDSTNQAAAISSYLKAQEDLDNGGGGIEEKMAAIARLSSSRSALEAMGIDPSQASEQLQQLENIANSRAGSNADRMKQAEFQTISELTYDKIHELTDYQRATLNETKAHSEIFGYINNHLARGVPINAQDLINILRSNTADPEGKHAKITEKPKVNVTIHRIEVQSDDPDRFVFRMVESFRDAAKNPSSALSAMREG